jgi:3-hydroxyacyl-CoA dehydrogenase
VDLVIEAVFEDLEVKKAVFKELDRVCKPGAVLATNTSIWTSTRLPPHQPPAGRDRSALLQPANIMKLLEIVVPARSPMMW